MRRILGFKLTIRLFTACAVIGMAGIAGTGCKKTPTHYVYEGKPVSIDSFTQRVTTLATIPGSDERIAIGFADSVFGVWDIQARKMVKEFNLHSHIINDLSVSTDGKLAAAASADKMFTLSEIETGKLVDSAYMISGPAMTLDMTTDMAYLAVGYGDGAIHIWNLDKHRRDAKFTEHDGVITKIRFRPGSHLMYSTAQDSFLYITNVEGGDSSSRMKQMYGFHTAIAFSPDGTFCATGGTDKLVKLWKVFPTDGNDSLSSLGWYQSDMDRIRDLAFSPDGALLVAVDHSGQVIFFELYDASDEPEKQNRFIAAGALGIILNELGRFRAHPGSIRTCSFSNNGRMLFTAGDDMTLKTWDVEDILTQFEKKKTEFEKR
ncbi:hypothetical protein GF359_04035 [candidate division WOR-3 bacterium]|uniref:WD40 repeat domain-containing protein n=1 Tax=candidate division WOR-3 bacterium TaxID=2052148 RepID=A0A9D5K8N3_UNCW3|nr:hypothetical protein [candidate division WOR-3 bacterium]MBD3364367.1 hypothetical protein [candidate division WOR-3 bacterium]